MSESIEKWFQTEFLEILWYIINDIFVLSKEFEWALWWEVNKNKSTTQLNVVNNYKNKFKKVEKYFAEKDLEEYPEKLLKYLEKILSELEEISIEVEKMPDEQKEKLVSFIKKTIKDNEKWASFKFSEKYREMLFIELWIDYIDDIWNAKDETFMLLNKIMMNK